MDDQTFYEACYGGSGIPEDIPIRVRKVYVEQLGDCWKGVRLDDNVCESDPDLDLAEQLFEIEDDFGIKIPWDEMRKLDGTFDAIVRYVASQRRPTSGCGRRIPVSGRNLESVRSLRAAPPGWADPVQSAIESA